MSGRLRIRQIKPEFFWDAQIAKELTPAERLLYVGLWLLADDAGWFRLEIAEMGATLLPYEPVEQREANVRQALDRLSVLGRIQVHDCGHGLIPTLTRHQRLAGETKRVYTIRDEHDARCSSTGRRPGDVPRVPAVSRGSPPGTERNGSERYGKAMPRSLNELCSMIDARYGIVASERQRATLLEIADRHGEGAIGFARLYELLLETDRKDWMAVLIEHDRIVKADGKRTADAQEAESSSRREDDRRSRRTGLSRVDDLLSIDAIFRG